jgi:O-methyltransferase
MTASIVTSTRRPLLALDSSLYAYVLQHQPPEHEAMSALRAETDKMPNAFLQIGPDQAHMMALMVKLMGARRILEIGTFTGYSTLAMALALPDDGCLITCDVNRDWADVGRKYWDRAGVAQRIELRIGPAIATLDALEQGGAKGSFDIIFIDANKEDYDNYYESALRLVRRGGLIILDNTLFLGRVADLGDHTSSAVALRELNAKIAQDERADRAMVPIGDGVTFVCRR